MKKLINKFSFILYPLVKAYWFIRRPKTEGVKVILQHGSRVLLVKHTYISQSGWTFPGGKIKKGEAPEEAAKREVKEELGLDLSNIKKLGSFVATKEYKIDTIWVFLAEVENVDVITPNFEIQEVRWFNLAAMPTLPATASRVWEIYQQT